MTHQLFRTYGVGFAPKSMRRLCRDSDALPVRRLFEPQWTYNLPDGYSRLERLSAHLTEVNTRLILPNDFLFKVDTASMRGKPRSPRAHVG